MREFDQYYTSEELSRRLLSFAKEGVKGVIADFAVGEGALLDAARQVYPNARFIGNDICKRNVQYLKRERSLEMANCDFRDVASIKRSRILRGLIGKCDLVVLNPPFSAKHTQAHKVLFTGNEVSCSVGCLFLFNSLPFLSKEGQLLCILPEGVLFSKREETFWKELCVDFRVKYSAVEANHSPNGWSAKSYLVSIERSRSRNTRVPKKKLPKALSLSGISVQVMRGNFDMSKKSQINGHGIRILHTTDIVQGDVCRDKLLRFTASSNSVKGPAVILPRVGNPKNRKVAYLSEGCEVSPSDCVFVLRTKSRIEAKRLQAELLQNWDTFSALYQGTCAKYLSKERLQKFLAKSDCVVCEF